MVIAGPGTQPSSIFYAQSPRDSSASTATTPDHPTLLLLSRSSITNHDDDDDSSESSNSNTTANPNSNPNSTPNHHNAKNHIHPNHGPHSLLIPNPDKQNQNVITQNSCPFVSTPLSSAPSSPLLIDLHYHNALGEPLHRLSHHSNTSTGTSDSNRSYINAANYHFIPNDQNMVNNNNIRVNGCRSSYILSSTSNNPHYSSLDPGLSPSGMMNSSKKILLGSYDNKWESVDEDDEEDYHHQHHAGVFNPADNHYSSSCNFHGNRNKNNKITRSILFFWCRVYMIAVISMLLFALLVLWLACTPQGSIVTVEDIEFLEFTLIHGSDRSQVPTAMLLVNANVTLNFHNPSRYFLMEFYPTLLALSYVRVPIAHGKVLPFNLNKGSVQPMLVKIESNEAPLYGAGISFEASGHEVDAHLKVSIDAQVKILRDFLRRRFLRDLNCNLKINVATQKLLHLKCN